MLQLPIVTLQIASLVHTHALPLGIALFAVGALAYGVGDLGYNQCIRVMNLEDFTPEEKNQAAARRKLYLIPVFIGSLLCICSCVVFGIGGYFDKILASLGF